MKSTLLYTICLLLLIFSCTSEKQKTTIDEVSNGFVANPQDVPEQEVVTLAIGNQAPDFTLPGTDGLMHTLDEYDSADVLAVLFICNHCPTAQAYEDRIIKVVEDYKDKSFQLVGISPNSPNGVLYEELGYSDLGDTYEAMKIRVKEKGYNFPYLYDGDDQKISLQYGPVATPHLFIFDKERKLQYHGRIDKSEKPGTAHAEDMRAALDDLLAGDPVATPTTKTFGCSTKWGWKTEYRIKADKEWDNKPVVINEIDKNQLSTLLTNESEGLRLINIWATWCGPCRLEYPSFLPIHRMFAERGFEFVSISMDQLNKKEAAHKFLEKSNSAVNNYISTIEDKYEFIEQIDPNWNGALPYTLLVEPGGNIYWSHQGEVDFQELKRTIVDHSSIGRFF